MTYHDGMLKTLAYARRPLSDARSVRDPRTPVLNSTKRVRVELDREPALGGMPDTRRTRIFPVFGEPIAL